MSNRDETVVTSRSQQEIQISKVKPEPNADIPRNGSEVHVVSREEPSVKRPPWYQYLVILIAISSGSIMTPFSQVMSTPSPLLQIVWRLQAMIIILAVIKFVMFLSSKRDHNEDYSFSSDKKPFNLVDYFNLLIASLGMFGNSIFLVWAAKYTLMSHANIFGGLASVLIILYRVMMCQRIRAIEVGGTMLAIIGCLVQVIDPQAEKVDGSQNIVLGDTIASFSSIACFFYIFAVNHCLQKLGSVDLTLWMSVIVTVVGGISGLLMADVTFDTDPQMGLFGWLNKETFWFNFIVIGLLSGIGTFLFYPLCIVCFSPLILGIVYLFEPAICAFYGVLLGLDKLPGPLTYIGTIVTLAGLYLLIFAENNPQPSSDEGDFQDGFQKQLDDGNLQTETQTHSEESQKETCFS